MKVALIGASGNIGSQIQAEALSRGHTITGIARNPDKITIQDGVTAKAGDITDPAALAETLKGHDAIIVSVRFRDFDVNDMLDAVRNSGVKRVLIVGGAGSLLAPDGSGATLLDSPNFPEAAKPEATVAAAGLKIIRDVDDLDWSFLSPSAIIGPGERTGKFRLGDDEALFDADGKSHISIPDFAIAMVDELEKNAHIRKRFTVGY